MIVISTYDTHWKWLLTVPWRLSLTQNSCFWLYVGWLVCLLSVCLVCFLVLFVCLMPKNLSTTKNSSLFESRCFHKLLGISYRDHITNEEVKARIGNAIGPYEDLLTAVKIRKLKWYRHVTQSSGLAKTVLLGTVQGGRRRGRQRKRWEDNIKEWTGLEWNIMLWKAENHEEWRKLVVKSTVVPKCQPDYGINKIRR